MIQFRVVQDKSVRGLLGMQLQLLGQLDPDPLRPEQLQGGVASWKVSFRAYFDAQSSTGSLSLFPVGAFVVFMVGTVVLAVLDALELR